jgi:YHS domain-containing protein
MATVTDPVCGMELESDDATEFVPYALVVYYFCSAECREKFTDDPSHFIGSKSVVGGTTAIPDDQQTHKPS